MYIDTNGKDFTLSFQYHPELINKVKLIPGRRWNKTQKIWSVPATLENVNLIKQLFPTASWHNGANAIISEITELKSNWEKIAKREVPDDDISNVIFKLPQLSHQKTAYLLARNQPVFAYLMEQGTGKSKSLLDDAAHNFREGNIDCLIIIAPNSVKTNWCDPEGGEDQISIHMAPDIEYKAASFFSAPNRVQREQWDDFVNHLTAPGLLKIAVFSVESFHSERIQKQLSNVLSATDAMVAIDESTRIKRPGAKRTKALLKLRKMAKMARIMSGTPIIKSPLDAYSQFGFLDPRILGYVTYSSFRARYAVMGGYLGKQVLTYQNTDELAEKIAGVSYRVTKKECLDLPDKIYQRRKIEMSEEQSRVYHQMKEEMIAKFSGNDVAVTIVLTQLLRLQQITANHLPVLDDVGEQIDVMRINAVSPKIKEALNIIDECSGKVIIWCRFKAEIAEVCEQLAKNDIKFVAFHGGVNEKDRVDARNAFQNDPEIKCFVGQIRTGGVGLTLTAANTVIYLSNSFSTEDRVQSEDRAHRIGQTESVNYIDIVCPGTIDIKVLQVMRDNKKISDEILHDNWQNWI